VRGAGAARTQNTKAASDAMTAEWNFLVMEITGPPWRDFHAYY